VLCVRQSGRESASANGTLGKNRPSSTITMFVVSLHFRSPRFRRSRDERIKKFFERFLNKKISQQSGRFTLFGATFP
jgi:hypothetical protein